jgi:hypothetical protein
MGGLLNSFSEDDSNNGGSNSAPAPDNNDDTSTAGPTPTDADASSTDSTPEQTTDASAISPGVAQSQQQGSGTSFLSQLLGGNGGNMTPSPKREMLSIAGRLTAAGMPYAKAVVAASGVQAQQQAARMQQFQMDYQRQQMQVNSQLMGALLGTPTQGMPAGAPQGNMAPPGGMPSGGMNPNAPSGQPMQGGGMGAPMMGANSNAPTLAQSLNNNMQGGGQVAPSQAGVASNPGAQQQDNSLFGNIDPQTRKLAALMVMKGDTQGAITMLNAAKTAQSPSGFQKNLAMSPARGGQGGTYLNPQGQPVSTDTAQMTTQDQQTVAAIQRLGPMMDTIINQMPQFQTAAAQGQVALQGVANKYLGGNYPGPSNQAAGEAAIQAVPDPLLRILGMPSTNESIKSIQQIVAPQPGESPQAYRERLINQKAIFSNDYAGAAQDRLANGISLTSSPQASSQQSSNSNSSTTNTSSQPNIPSLEALLAEKQRRMSSSKSGS